LAIADSHSYTQGTCNHQELHAHDACAPPLHIHCLSFRSAARRQDPVGIPYSLLSNIAGRRRAPQHSPRDYADIMHLFAHAVRGTPPSSTSPHTVDGTHYVCGMHDRSLMCFTAAILRAAPSIFARPDITAVHSSRPPCSGFLGLGNTDTVRGARLPGADLWPSILQLQLQFRAPESGRKPSQHPPLTEPPFSQRLEPSRRPRLQPSWQPGARSCMMVPGQPPCVKRGWHGPASACAQCLRN
jgi:hypothetical protein